jgi:hypothetical protein
MSLGSPGGIFIYESAIDNDVVIEYQLNDLKISLYVCYSHSLLCASGPSWVMVNCYDLVHAKKEKKHHSPL